MGFLWMFLGAVGLAFFVRAAAPLFIPALRELPEGRDALRDHLAEDLGGQITADGDIRFVYEGRTVYVGIAAIEGSDQLRATLMLRDVLPPGPRVVLRPPVHAYVGDPREHFRVGASDGDRLKQVLAHDEAVAIIASLLPVGEDAMVTVDERGGLVVAPPECRPFRSHVMLRLATAVRLAEVLGPPSLPRPSDHDAADTASDLDDDEAPPTL